MSAHTSTLPQAAPDTSYPERQSFGARIKQFFKAVLLWLSIAAVFSLLCAVVVTAVTFYLFGDEIAERKERDKYGELPTISISAWVGHAEQGRGLTKIQTTNNGREIIVQEWQGGDPSLAKLICRIPLVGNDRKWWRGYLELKRLNRDEDDDLVVTVRGQRFEFLNRDGEFIPIQTDLCLKTGQPDLARQGQSLVAAPTQIRKTGMPNPPLVVEGQRLSVLSRPTITVTQILRVLKQYNSPIADEEHAQYIYDVGERWGIDPAIALAFFAQESGAGTKEVGARNKNFGNIRVGESNPYDQADGYRKYPNWKAAIEDFYRLIGHQYVKVWNLSTVEAILEKYAPRKENDTLKYVGNVRGMVDQWRKESARLYETDV